MFQVPELTRQSTRSHIKILEEGVIGSTMSQLSSDINDFRQTVLGLQEQLLLKVEPLEETFDATKVLICCDAYGTNVFHDVVLCGETLDRL